MKSTKKALIAVGVAATLGLSATTANAGVLASSIFSITNFVISDNTTGNALSLSSFSGLVATNNAGVSASLVGDGSASDNFNLAITNPNTDLTAVCVGGGCGAAPAENNFNVLTPPIGPGKFAHADEFLTGAAIDLGAGAGATAQVRSDVSLGNSGDGTADSNVGLNATFIFTLAAATDVAFSFDGLVDLVASIDAGTNFPGNAQASSALDITITDLASGAVVFDFTGTGLKTGCDLGHTLNRNAPFNGTSTYTCNDSFFANTGLLSASNTYQLSIRQNTNADALLVPEPGTIALLGAGLFGLGMARRRSNRKQ